MTIENEVRQGWHDAIIEMYEIDLSTIGDGFSGQYFLTNEIMPDNSFVVWKGQTYTSFPIEAGGFDISTKGQMAQPEITVANIFGTFSDAISSADDLVGAKVIRRRTLFKYLDNGPSPDSSQEFPDDIFYVERKSGETNITVTWQLASKIDLEGLLLPRRVITQDHCLWRYRGPECGYSGPPVANEFDEAPEGSSAEAQAYIAALGALQVANARAISAQVELDNARAAQEIVCSIGIIQLGEPRFNLRGSNGAYIFGIQDRGQYFAAYDDNTVIPAANFEGSLLFGQQEEGDAVFGAPQNTGKGVDNNGTGPVYAINRWVAVYGEDPLIPEDLTLAETRYSPPNYFAFFDIENSPIICVNGTIPLDESVRLETPPGEKPSLSSWPPGQAQAWAIGDRKENDVSPVTDLQIWEQSSSQCDAATERFEAAEAELEAAETAQAAAQAAFDAALAALPTNDALYDADRCGKRLTSCRLRFGTSTLPFGAFPGANLYR